MERTILTKAKLSISLYLRLDTSPLSSSPMNAQIQWHGNIETSTDTLVPELVEEKIRSEMSISAMSNSKESSSSENGIEMSVERHRSHFLPDVHNKFKTLPNGSLHSAMDEIILIQPEQQRMELFNGNRPDSSQTMSIAAMPNGNGNVPLYRRRRNSFNSKPPPCIADIQSTPYMRSDSISPNTVNSKFALPNTSRMLPATQPALMRTINTPSQLTTNISSIACPDGLAHALSEQNLRLQQIVHEHKASKMLYRN